jgi:hypothetical protein
MTGSLFVDDAAEESGDEVPAHRGNAEGGEEDGETAAAAADHGFDTADGFVIGAEQAGADDEAAAAEAAAAATAAEEEALEQSIDRTELEEEMRELARDHGVEIAQRRKRLKRVAAEEPKDELEDGIAEEAAALASVQQQRREAKRSAAAAAVLVSGKQQSHRPARASMRPQGGGPGGTTGDSKKSRGKYGKLWNKRHDMKLIAKPAKKKPGKAKAVDLF